MPVQNKTSLTPIDQNIYSDFDKSHNISLIQGNTIEILKSIPNNFISLIITSPPYNLGKIYEKKVDFEDYLQKQEEVIKELIRVLNLNGNLCWEVGNYISNGEVFPLDVYFYHIFKKYDLQLRNRIIWHFGHGLHCKNRFSGRYETVLWFTKSDDYIFNLDAIRVPSKYPGKKAYKGPNKGKPSGNPLGKNPSDVWNLLKKEWESAFWEFPNVKSNHPEKTIHPCQFPIELAERCVLALTHSNDYILDPYCGVGSSLIAGIKHSRKVIGIDKEAKYIGLTKKRIQDFLQGNLKLRPLGKKIYKPTGKEKVAQIPEEWKDLT